MRAQPGGVRTRDARVPHPRCHAACQAGGVHDDAAPIPPYEFSPWDFWRDADDAARNTQIAHIEALAAQHPDHRFGDLVFVARHTSVDNEVLHLGDRSYVAAGAYLTGSLRAGADCSINPYAVVRGDVTLGDGVRVGAHTSILGFNHSMEPGTPVHRQPLTSKGIVIGDDVWIGSHVVVLDGVRVGDHAVLAAGAVVTKDVPAGAIVAGNPARFLRWRVEPDAAADDTSPSLPPPPPPPPPLPPSEASVVALTDPDFDEVLPAAS